ncbi:MAG: hypothetical protein AAF728_00180 [Cyanobacteria bacterium P01_D01_bin.128]
MMIAFVPATPAILGAVSNLAKTMVNTSRQLYSSQDKLTQICILGKAKEVNLGCISALQPTHREAAARLGRFPQGASRVE